MAPAPILSPSTLTTLTPYAHHILHSVCLSEAIYEGSVHAIRKTLQKLYARYALRFPYRRIAISHTHSKRWMMAETKKSVYVCFRGTKTLEDVIHDLNFWNATHDGGAVHAGFLQRVKNIPIQHMAHMLEQGKTLVVTGHSLGGGLAMLTALMLIKKYQDKSAKTDPEFLKRIVCITFGAPLTANEELALLVHAQYKRHFFHFCDQNDIIPKLLVVLNGTMSSTERIVRDAAPAFQSGIINIIDKIVRATEISQSEQLQQEQEQEQHQPEQSHAQSSGVNNAASSLIGLTKSIGSFFMTKVAIPVASASAALGASAIVSVADRMKVSHYAPFGQYFQLAPRPGVSHGLREYNCTIVSLTETEEVTRALQLPPGIGTHLLDPEALISHMIWIYRSKLENALKDIVDRDLVAAEGFGESTAAMDWPDVANPALKKITLTVLDSSLDHRFVELRLDGTSLYYVYALQLVLPGYKPVSVDVTEENVTSSSLQVSIHLYVNSKRDAAVPLIPVAAPVNASQSSNDMHSQTSSVFETSDEPPLFALRIVHHFGDFISFTQPELQQWLRKKLSEAELNHSLLKVPFSYILTT